MEYDHWLLRGADWVMERLFDRWPEAVAASAALAGRLAAWCWRRGWPRTAGTLQDWQMAWDFALYQRWVAEEPPGDGERLGAYIK